MKPPSALVTRWILAQQWDQASVFSSWSSEHFHQRGHYQGIQGVRSVMLSPVDDPLAGLKKIVQTP